jgi:hypothetical protein
VPIGSFNMMNRSFLICEIDIALTDISEMIIPFTLCLEDIVAARTMICSCHLKFE